MADKSEANTSPNKQSGCGCISKIAGLVLVFSALWIMLMIWGVESNRSAWVKKTQVPITLTNYVDAGRPAGELWVKLQHDGIILDAENLLTESTENTGWRVQDGCLVSTSANDSITLMLDAPADAQLILSSFSLAGQIQVSRDGYSQVYDLYAQESGQKIVDPLADMIYEEDTSRILLMIVLAGIVGVLALVVVVVICSYNKKLAPAMMFILPAAYYLVGVIENSTYLTLGLQIMLLGYFLIMGLLLRFLRKKFCKKAPGKANCLISFAVSAAAVLLLNKYLLPDGDGMLFNKVIFAVGAVILYAFLISWAVEWYQGRKEPAKSKK